MLAFNEFIEVSGRKDVLQHLLVLVDTAIYFFTGAVNSIIVVYGPLPLHIAS